MTDDKLKGLRNCKKCGRLFSSTNGSYLCSRCSDSIDDEFTRVREYIYDNPSSSVKDVAEGTGVESEAILKWIREGKIVLGEGARISFCERCDEPTDGSRFCPKCARELSQGLKSGLESKETSKKDHIGMHIKEPTKK